MSMQRRRAFWFLALFAAWQGDGVAQEKDCVAQVKITALGVPRTTETRRSMLRSLVPYHYRLDAASEEKRCINVNFDIVLHYVNNEDKADMGPYPISMRIRGGAGSEFGELPGRKDETRPRATIEDIVCKRC